MPKARSHKANIFPWTGGVPRPATYGHLSTRPLHTLCFLAPFLVLYEVGSLLYLREPSKGMIETISARRMFSGFFEVFGIASFHIPPIALCVILLTWHILERDPWGIRPRVLGGMAAESIMWTLPLLAFGLLFQIGRPALLADGGMLADLSWQARLTLSAGAGIYEELLFRMILISGVHFVVVDLLHGSKGVGYTIGGVVSALAFAFYHNVSHPGGGVDLSILAYYSLAGMYLSALFIFRGFGMAVAVHAIFDAIVLLAIPIRSG